MSIEQTKQIAYAFFAAQDRLKGPLDPNVVAEDYIGVIGSNPPMDIASHSGFGVMFYQGFPDLYHTIDEVIAEGDEVVVRFTLRGVQRGDFMGIPPTGRAIEVTAIAHMHLVEGKVTRLNAQFDQVGMLQQLGVIPAPA
jgi:predicted ester cyclase